MSEKPTTGKEKKSTLQSLKGMRDISGDEYYRYQGLFEKAQEIAVYYGFKPIETPLLEKEELFVRSVGESTDIVEKEIYTLRTKGGDKLALRPEGTAPIMRAYIEQGMQNLPQPVMLYYSGPFFRHERPQRGRSRQFMQFGFEILGSPKSIADAIIIRTMMDVLEEVGFKDLSIDINSIGDSECRPAYIRALTAYYRKHIDKLCVHCKKRLKDNPLRLLDCKDKGCEVLKEEAPESLNHLCGGCKQHFKEVLEYLDTMGIPYSVKNSLVRGLDYYTRTVFEIIESIAPTEEPIKEATPNMEDEKEGDVKEKEKEVSEESNESGVTLLTIAAGGRYDNLAKSLGSKKPVPAVGGAIGMDRLVMRPELKSLSPRIIKKPKIYFIQLGFEAKLKSLSVIELLRKAKIPIAQSLNKDSLATQLSTAERLNVPYTIIFGQKEAMEGTVIVRNMENRSQDTISIEKLPEYLKKIKGN